MTEQAERPSPPMSVVAVVGTGLAGLSSARALRELGFTGRVVLVGDEKHDPYDRPPLSKSFLAGEWDPAKIALGLPTDAELDLDWRLGQRAVSLRPAEDQGWVIGLQDSEELKADGVVIATGARARKLPAPEPLSGVHTLRTLDDAIALKAELVPGARLVVVGGGFIGAEIASTAVGLEVEVTVVEMAPALLAGPLGVEVGAAMAALHEANGVRILTGVGVSALTPDPHEPGWVGGVVLADGRELPADVVVVGIGSEPNTEWLQETGLVGHGPEGSLAGGVLTDEDGRTALPGVVATGDCTAVHHPFAGRVMRQEHWTHAAQHPTRAVAALLGVPAPPLAPAMKVPYVWSEQYGKNFQFAGHHEPGDETELVEGDLTGPAFTVIYRRGGEPVGVFGVGQPKVFGRWRRELAQRLP
ncbi:FAD-dependent oxidoreductase [Kineosporia rhizophila]|uniref:NAD(P)/FAD-dependent oxidoreductase n=1 Tax=Kineosporia TaxID=49184 RepID=UPI001E575B8A|nr:MULTISPECIES: FAD-dependent oxidoreductase [Kineosporia]MCE0535950.1 FAD-dependent oxidoreductase [Kineosporia rhizophila]GLY14220.1 pyridine nucleotide-disulfide oxidoreductase [Kineosporia sp. NBRC 101677]